MFEAFNSRGLAYTHEGNYDRAIQDFDQALHLAPNDANGLTAGARRTPAKEITTAPFEATIKRCR